MLVSAQTMTCVEVRFVLVPLPGSVASAAALELRKYSVPPAVRSPVASGDVDGASVKPFSKSLTPLIGPWRSNCVTLIVGALAASACLENA